MCWLQMGDALLSRWRRAQRCVMAAEPIRHLLALIIRRRIDFGLRCALAAHFLAFSQLVLHFPGQGPLAHTHTHTHSIPPLASCPPCAMTVPNEVSADGASESFSASLNLLSNTDAHMKTLSPASSCGEVCGTTNSRLVFQPTGAYLNNQVPLLKKTFLSL